MGSVKNTICKRLVTDWPKLADHFDIPLDDRTAFRKGRKPQGVWEWLEQRGRLNELPDGLQAIDRAELADLFRQAPPPAAADVFEDDGISRRRTDDQQNRTRQGRQEFSHRITVASEMKPQHSIRPPRVLCEFPY